MIDINLAQERIKDIVVRTALMKHQRLSEKYQCNVFLKREDQQIVRSYKIRGAFNKIISLDPDLLMRGIVCASAGNHAQGVAYSCKFLRIEGSIFMPANTPSQKINRVKMFGGDCIEIFLEGDSYDESAEAALKYMRSKNLTMIPPFDDERIIEGQATVGLEILEDLPDPDYIFLPVGGGGLAAGIGTCFKDQKHPAVLVAVEPEGAASLTAAFRKGQTVRLDKLNPFIDGAAVSKVGELTYKVCRETIDHVTTVDEGKVCSTLLELYNHDGIVTEPAGALAIAALDDFADEIKGKNVVCIVSGGNNDSNRMEEIKKLADEWEGLQHHLIIRFHHYPDGLKEFFTKILGEDNYINRIEYMRRDHGRSTYGLVGIRTKSQKGYEALQQRMTIAKIEYREVAKEDFLFKYWV